MRCIHRSAFFALSLAVAGAGIAGCGSSGNPKPGAADYVDGKTFTLAIGDDPGALDPQAAVTGILMQVNKFAYDSLVGISDKGEIVPQLAKSWKVGPKSVTFEIGSGITCSDGAPFTAKTVAANIDYVADASNHSQYRGIYVPADAAATASGSTVTVKLAAPAPFVLNGLADMPMVCDSGLNDRSIFKTRSAGTGPYVLTKVVPGDRYEFKVRKGYKWGPAGARTDARGTPAKVDIKVVSNETTAANELLSGAINASMVLGPDADRLAGAGLSSEKQPSLIGEQSYNHAPGHATSDPAVRMALTQALDLKALRTALTSGKGKPATQLTVAAPAACTGNSVSGAVPGTDVSAAEAALDKAGWVKGGDGVRAKGGKKLSLTFDYFSELGSGGAAAAELAVAAWKKIGVEVKSKSMTLADWSALTGTGDWDILWLQFNSSSPDQLVSILSPPTPPKGNDFAWIDNADYNAHVAKALTLSGADSCPEWLAAESALFKAADLVPFANNVVRVFFKGATLKANGPVTPTSVKMLG